MIVKTGVLVEVICGEFATSNFESVDREYESLRAHYQKTKKLVADGKNAGQYCGASSF